MKREDINEEMKNRAFEFFFRYTRFEYALIANGFLWDLTPGARARPNWRAFVADHHREYRPSNCARQLVDANPEREVVGADGGISWKRVTLRAGQGELGRVVEALQVVRNNLFHGGKHGSKEWDNPQRTARLLSLGSTVLDEIAHETGIGPDFRREY